MNTAPYYLQRLLPFAFVYVLLEIIEFSLASSIIGLCPNPLEGQSIYKLFINLCFETAVGFSFMVLPYVIYLLILPAEFHGGRMDKYFTRIIFALFCFINGMEEMLEVLGGDQFNQLTTQLVKKPSAVAAHLLNIPHFNLWMLGMLLLIATLFYAMHNKLMASVRPPHYLRRLLTPCFLVALAFLLNCAAQGISPHELKPVLYQDGIYSLFGGIYAFTAVPSLGDIFSAPCLFISALAVGFYLINYSVERLLAPTYSPYNLLKAAYTTTARKIGSTLTLNIFLLLLGIMLIRLWSLGIYPLMDTTEARYGEMARKMLETGNWLYPLYDYGVPFWGKPPLSFWASAVTMTVFGVNEWAARLAPFLCVTAMAALFFCWSFTHKRVQQAMACSVVLFTCALGFVASGAVMTDAYLALGVMLSMLAFWRAMTSPKPSKLWGALFFLGLLIGLYSKGPLALVLCGIPIFLWTLIRKEWPALWRRIPWLTGTLCLLALTLPWYLAVEQATPGFLRYFFIGEHFERFVVKGWKGDLYGSGHSRPLGMIWFYALIMFLPWALLLPFLFRRCLGLAPTQKQPSDGSTLFLCLWAVTPMLFFTVARNILPAYVLPSTAALCLLLVRRIWQAGLKCPAVKKLIFVPLPLCLIILLFGLGHGFSYIEYRCHKDILTRWDGTSPLYYHNEMVRYSGQFYSNGKAVKEQNVQKLLAAGAAGRCYVVIEEGNVDTAALQHGGWQEVGRTRKWLMLRSTVLPQ